MSKPETTFRIGAVSASVFVNDSKNGCFRSVTLQRSFKDGETWRTSTSFTIDQLPLAVAVLQQATNYILELEQSEPVSAQQTSA